MYEKLEGETALKERSSPFFNKPGAYAMKLFAYYMCYKVGGWVGGWVGEWVV